jgi:hypothetical protein
MARERIEIPGVPRDVIEQMEEYRDQLLNLIQEHMPSGNPFVLSITLALLAGDFVGLACKDAGRERSELDKGVRLHCEGLERHARAAYDEKYPQ